MNQTYNQKGKITTIDSIMSYLPMVHKIANQINKKTNYILNLDDLIQVGTMGLMEAQKNYIPQNNSKFETYAYIKIQGSILDELRKSDVLNQEERALYKLIVKTIKYFQNNNIVYNDIDIAKKCNIDINEYFNIINKNQLNESLSLEDSDEYLNIIDNKNDPDKSLEKKEILNKIANIINTLNEKEQQLMSLMYVEDLTVTEIADILNLSKARVSQIHSNCILKIKSNIIY